MELKRIASIDTFRAFSIITMVTWHFVGFMSDSANDNCSIFIKNIIYFFGSMLSVPSFLICSGMSNSYVSLRKITSGNDKTNLMYHTAKKGFAIYVIGVIYTAFIHGINNIAYMWILQCIGMCMIITSVMYMHRMVTLIALISLLILFPALQQIVLGVAGTHKMLLVDFSFVGLVKSVFISGGFAVIPWVIPYIIGILIGYSLHNNANHGLKHIINGLIIGSSSVLIGIILKNIGEIQFCGKKITLSISKYPASLTYILIFSGISIVLFYILYLLFDYHKEKIPLSEYVNLLSKFSLTIFCAHYAIGLVIILKGLSSITDNPFIAIAASIIFIFTMAKSLKIWERWDYKYSLEYFVNLLVNKMTL